MTNFSQQNIAQFFQNNGKDLQIFLTKLGHLNKLNQVLIDNIEPSLATHCRVVDLKENCLVLMTESAIWATHLRFHIPQLLTKLRQYPQLQTLTQIHCKVMPVAINQRLIKSQKKPMPPLSPQTAKIILEITKNIKSDKLKSIMQKIAKNHSST